MSSGWVQLVRCLSTFHPSVNGQNALLYTEKEGTGTGEVGTEGWCFGGYVFFFFRGLAFQVKKNFQTY